MKQNLFYCNYFYKSESAFGQRLSEQQNRNITEPDHFDLASMLIHMDVMAATAIPAIAAFGHPAHHMPITQEQLSVCVGACPAEVPTEDRGTVRNKVNN